MNDALLACSVGDIAWLKRCLSSDCDLFTTNKDVSYKINIGHGYFSDNLTFAGAELFTSSSQE